GVHHFADARHTGGQRLDDAQTRGQQHFVARQPLLFGNSDGANPGEEIDILKETAKDGELQVGMGIYKTRNQRATFEPHLPGVCESPSRSRSNGLDAAIIDSDKTIAYRSR